MSGTAQKRLQQERVSWRKDHPFGFAAKYAKNSDGSQNMLIWECRVPGKKSTMWEGGEYPILLHFTEDYPGKPPKCKFPEKFYHPNIYPSGTVCLSILNEDEDWKPSITIKDILLGVQDLLANPNPASPAQEEAFHDFTQKKDDYVRKVKVQMGKYTPADAA